MTDASRMDPTGRFTGRAEDYARHRPTYPSAAISAILDGLDPLGNNLAVDIGAGTGISSRLLAERGVRVIAVEPNAAMRQEATPHPMVTFVEGTAEALPVPGSSADLALCAQAFHWFRAAEAVREIARVLRPGGRLALVWNRRSKTDPLTAAYRDALLAVGASPSIEAMDADLDAVTRSGSFGELVESRFPHGQILDRAGFIGRALSASYAPKTGPEADRLVAMLDALHRRFAGAEGVVRLEYETQVLLASRR